ncbi:ABC transporter substrate-binding protein [Candidatus Uabimicrobium sp. HlEnr_7]|uniref:ABC transporter substrate-binding protein n=1 Tax=Candidatus Uabimicrobium helgolandensis TaxID=3095367 RepID=UPI003557AA67
MLLNIKNVKTILIVFVLYCGCTIFTSATENRTLYCADFSRPQNLIPITATQSVENRICQFIFDSLVVQEQDNKFTLSLAQEVDVSPDSLSFTFLLNRNIKWQDGSPLTARDIQFTLEVLLNPLSVNYNPVLKAFIDDVTFVNPKTITITLSQPFYEPLALFTFKILPQHILQQNLLQKNSAFAKNPVGCGPFKYKKGIGSDEVVLVANEHFTYRKKPFFNKVIFRKYNSVESAIKDLSGNKLHVIPQLNRKISSQNILYKPNSEFNIHYLKFNYTRDHHYKNLFSETKFRIALLNSIDREKIAKQAFSSNKKCGISGPFPRKSWFYNNKISESFFDLGSARRALNKILIANGYVKQKYWQKEGRILELNIKSFPTIAIKLIANSFEKIGLKTNIDNKPNKNYDIYYQTYTFSNTTDIIRLFSLYDMGKNNNIYQNSELAELLYELHSTLNPWAVQDIGRNIHSFIHKEMPFIFLWQLDSYVAYNKGLNIKLHPTNSYRFPETWKLQDN